MILGIGTDIVDVGRIERSMSRNPRLGEKLFTEAERAYCEGRASRYQSYAARFAAKEAVMKAIGTGWDGYINWQDIEVCSDALGKPGIICHNAVRSFMEEHHVREIHISLSHEKTHAIAYVILETKD